MRLRLDVLYPTKTTIQGAFISFYGVLSVNLDAKVCKANPNTIEAGICCWTMSFAAHA